MTAKPPIITDAWFQMVFQESSSGLAFLDQDLHFISVNPQMHGIMGYNESDLLSPCSTDFPLEAQESEGEITIIDLITPADRSRASEDIRKVVRGESLGFLEYDGLHKDGSIVPILLKMVAIKETGKLSGLMALFQVKKERKVVRTQTIKSIGMDASAALINEVVYDFSDIITIILDNIELVKAQAPAGDNIRNPINRALKGCRRAKDLVLQVQRFGRQTRNAHRPAQVGAIIRETIEILKAAMPPTIDIRLNIQSDALVMMDRTLIHQIVTNLCSNAVYSMRAKGGVISIKLEDMVLDGNRPSVQEFAKAGSYLKLTLCDTGSGMPPEVIEHVFDPAFIVKEKGVGLGVGFAAVNDIVLSHGGLITVYSEMGKGSTFEILLPLFEEIQDSGEKTIIRVSGGAERLLFVDDERDFTMIAKALLQPLGYEVTTRTNSREALKLFRENPAQYDLVITDMLMPQLSGDQLAKEIFAIRSAMPIILCTGFGLLSIDEKAAEIGIRAIIRKPIILDELVRTIRKVLDDRERESASE